MILHPKFIAGAIDAKNISQIQNSVTNGQRQANHHGKFLNYKHAMNKFDRKKSNHKNMLIVNKDK